MFPSFSLPYSLLKLHIAVFIIFLCFICRAQSIFFLKLFPFYLLERPNNINIQAYKTHFTSHLSLLFFYNHFKFSHHESLIWMTEKTIYNILRRSNLPTVSEVFLFSFFFVFHLFCFSSLISCLVRSVSPCCVKFRFQFSLGFPSFDRLV